MNNITFPLPLLWIGILLLLTINCTEQAHNHTSIESPLSKGEPSTLRQALPPLSSDEKPYLYISTLGQKGHGKTTLAAAISKRFATKENEAQSYETINTPTVSKERGIFLRASQIEFETEGRRYSLEDCPEYTDFLTNIISGAMQLDGAILVVDATTGPMPQTREQVLLARQSGIDHLVVFLNKADLVDDEELLELVELEIRDLLSADEFDGKNTPVIWGSALGALNGDPEWEASVQDLIQALDNHIPTPVSPTKQDFLMPVEDVFSIQGRGTVVTGRIERGRIHRGDPVEIIGLRDPKEKPLTSVCTGVEMFRQIRDQAEAGEAVGLLLRGIKKNDVKRGMVIAKPYSVHPHTKFKAELYVLSKEEGGPHRPLPANYRPNFFFRTTDIAGTLTLPEGVEKVMPGDHVTITADLNWPVAMEAGLRFAIREEGRTVAAGLVVRVGE